MGTESMSDEQLAAWMQSEHEMLVSLMKIIREHVGAMPAINVGKWLDGLRAAYDRLVVHLRRNFAAQESGGYLSFIVDQQPTLSKQVERTRMEHPQLLRMADRIAADIAECRPEDRVLLADATARVQRFIAVVAQHDQRENMLALFVTNQDIGSGDY